MVFVRLLFSQGRDKDSQCVGVGFSTVRILSFLGLTGTDGRLGRPHSGFRLFSFSRTLHVQPPASRYAKILFSTRKSDFICTRQRLETKRAEQKSVCPKIQIRYLQRSAADSDMPPFVNYPRSRWAPRLEGIPTTQVRHPNHHTTKPAVCGVQEPTWPTDREKRENGRRHHPSNRRRKLPYASARASRVSP
jgi:hypothetical protein